MTLTDAIKSNKPFRRPGWPWYTVVNNMIFSAVGGVVSLTVKQILAEDWEVKED